jgi:hypothetical protein
MEMVRTRYGHCPARSDKVARETPGKGEIMLNKVNGKQELDRVNMFIRAISAEMAKGQPSASPNPVAAEMEEALYELRLRKLLISALVDPDRVADTTNH